MVQHEHIMFPRALRARSAPLSLKVLLCLLQLPQGQRAAAGRRSLERLTDREMCVLPFHRLCVPVSISPTRTAGPSPEERAAIRSSGFRCN